MYVVGAEYIYMQPTTAILATTQIPSFFNFSFFTKAFFSMWNGGDNFWGEMREWHSPLMA